MSQINYTSTVTKTMLSNIHINVQHIQPITSTNTLFQLPCELTPLQFM